MNDLDEDLFKYVDTIPLVKSNEDRKFVLNKYYKLFVSIFPLVLNTIYGRKKFVCPTLLNKLYGITLVIMPSVCVLLVMIMSIHERLVKKKSKAYISKNSFIKIAKDVVLFGIIASITLGMGFIQGDYYACYVMGSAPSSSSPSFSSYSSQYNLHLSISIICGWGIILVAVLIATSLVIVTNIRGSRKPLDILVQKFADIRRQKAEDLLYDELTRLGKDSASQKVAKVIQKSKDRKNCDISTIKSYIRGVIQLEESPDRIDYDRPEVVIG